MTLFLPQSLKRSLPQFFVGRPAAIGDPGANRRMDPNRALGLDAGKSGFANGARVEFFLERAARGSIPFGVRTPVAWTGARAYDQ